MPDVEPDAVDLHRFRRLVKRARDPRSTEAEKANALWEALSLWRGTPLAGIPGRWAEAETPAQLPPDAPGFIGREAELAQLDALPDKACDQSNAAVIPAVAGTAGVGKPKPGS